MTKRKHNPFAALSAFLAIALVAVIVLALAGAFGGGGDDGERSAAGPGTLPSPAAPLPSGTSVADLYERVSPGVVLVETGGGSPALGGEGGTGSGFVIDDRGRIVTNQHVVEDAQDVRVRFAAAEGEDDAEAVAAEVIGTDPSTDLALLKVDPSDVDGGLKPLALGDSARLRVGEPTVAIGSPFGLEGSLTTGVVSALNRDIESPNGFPIDKVLQTDAAINPGNSGGPLLDARGRVIGVNAQIASGSRANSGVGFAIPVNTVKEVVPALERDGEIRRPYLGVSTSDVDAQVARELGLSVQDGALVQTIVPGGPAAEGGLRAGAQPTGRGGDVIVGVDGKRVNNPEDLADAIEDSKPGDRARIEVIRGDDRQIVIVTLGERPNDPQGP